MYISTLLRTTSLVPILLISVLAVSAQTKYYVSPSGNDGNSGLAGSPKRTINAAIGVASNSDTVIIAAGTYAENVRVTKSLTLKGANYNVSCTGTRGAESIVSGVSASGTSAILIETNDVTVNGLTVTNPNGSNGVMIMGKSNINVRHNVVTNVGNSVTGTYSSYGIFDEITYATANTTNVTISNNCISDIRGGANTSLVDEPAQDNNGPGGGIGIGSANVQYDVSGVTISGNTIDNIKANTNSPSNGGKGVYGILVSVGAPISSVAKVTGAQITNNVITHLEGAWVHGIGLEGETPGARVLNNYLDLFTDHSIREAIGVMFEDNAGAATVQVHENSFTNMGYGLVNVTNDSVDATCNWYGSSNPADVGDMVVGRVTFKPWLSNGTNSKAAGTNGYQPVPGACIGGIPTKVSALSWAGVKVYPNPVATDLQITFPSRFNGTVSLISATGARVYNEQISGSTSFMIPMARFAQGVYALVLTDDKGASDMRKVMVVR